MWLPDSTTFKCDSQYLPSWFRLLRYLYANNLYTTYFHPHPPPHPRPPHHHHISVMQLGHLLTRSVLTYPEVSSKVYHESFCQLGSNISLLWVIYFEAFCLHVISRFSCIPLICPKLVLFLTPLQFVHLFCNLSKCILLFFSCISCISSFPYWPI